LKLIIDIGNSSVKIAVFKGKQLLCSEKQEKITADYLLTFTQEYSIKRTIISSVIKRNKEIDNIITHFDAIYLSTVTPLPIHLNYKTPKTLGKDRVSAIVGASVQFPSVPVLVFDAGTCLTFDFIDKKKVYHGGRISPGIKMRFDALHHFTAELPLIEGHKHHNRIGDDTDSSIISGVQAGILAEVDAIIDDFRKENEALIVIGTGGDCFFFEKELKNSIFADPFLVLKGLNEILDYNE